MSFRTDSICARVFAVLLLVWRIKAFTYGGTLQPMAILQLDWDLSFFGSRGMKLQQDFHIDLQSSSDVGQTWVPIQLPNYYNLTLNPNEVRLEMAQWQVTNTAATAMSWIINVTLINGVSADALEMDSYFSVKRHFKVTQKGVVARSYLSFVGRQTTSDHIPPYNLLVPNGNPVLVQLRSSSLLNNDYKLQAPYTSAFWNSFSVEVEVLPWLPYFGACLNYGQRLYLHELLDAYDAETNVAEDIRLKNLAALLVRRQRQFETRCVFGESNIYKQSVPWWRASHPALFYLSATAATNEQRQSIIQATTNGLDDKVDTLVAVSYSSEGVPLGVPDRVQLTITYLNDSGLDRKIVRAELVAYFSDQASDNSTLLQIRLVPLNDFQSVLQGCASPLTYFLLFLPIVLAISIAISCLPFKSTDRRVIGRKVFRFLLGPIYKAILLIVLICVFPNMVLLTAGKITKYSMIGYNYDGVSLDALSVSRIEKGRIGLSMIVAGFIALMAFVSRTYKIPNREQAEILLRDLIEQKQLSQKQRYAELEARRINHRAEFMIETLAARRFRVAVVLILCCSVQCFFYEQMLMCKKWILLVLILVWPLVIRVQVSIISSHTDNLLFTVPFHLAGDYMLSVVLVRYRELWQLTVGRSVACLYYSCFPLICSLTSRRLFDWLSLHPNNLLARLFESRIKEHQLSKSYDRELDDALRITQSICSVLFRPVILLLFYLLQKEGNLTSEVFPEPGVVNSHMIYVVLQQAVEISVMIVIIDLLRRRSRIDLFEMLEYSLHRFRCRSVKWALDTFKFKSTVRPSMRSIEKLCFSSQFYFLSVGMGFSLVLLVQGTETVVRNSYIVYQDPFFIAIPIFIIVFARVCELLAGYVFAKGSFYQIKNPKNRKQLDSACQFTRKDNEESSLQLEAVKNHFLRFNREWIVANLPRILTKRNFHEDGKRLLNCYIYQLNMQKRKRLERRRREAEKQRLREEHQQKQAKQHNRIFSLSKQVMQRMVIPIMQFWLNLSREHMHLRKYVQILKQPLPNCEFCKIDLQLEVLERFPFHSIVNKFRVANTGRVFLAHEFLEFYRTQQQFITTCFECRLKKEHVHRNERLEAARSRNNLCARLLIRKWLVCARSRILHRDN